jgi:GGDEF domain-containing protein
MLEKELDRSKWRDYACALLMAEIDDFGVLADGGKTSEADNAVDGFVRTLADKSRPGDIIGHTDRSEFGLILPEITRTGAGVLGQEVCRRAGWNFTVSADLATYPRDASDAEGLIEKARDAIMVAKSEGGNTVVLPS